MDKIIYDCIKSILNQTLYPIILKMNVKPQIHSDDFFFFRFKNFLYSDIIKERYLTRKNITEQQVQHANIMQMYLSFYPVWTWC